MQCLISKNALLIPVDNYLWFFTDIFLRCVSAIPTGISLGFYSLKLSVMSQHRATHLFNKDNNNNNNYLRKSRKIHDTSSFNDSFRKSSSIHFENFSRDCCRNFLGVSSEILSLIFRKFLQRFIFRKSSTKLHKYSTESSFRNIIGHFSKQCLQ